MSVLTGKALHEQLSVIMGALTTAAVAEICELVDEGFAVLRMEINRSHQENDDLRKKLHLIESIVVRGGGGTGVGTGGSTGGGTGGSGTGGSGTGGKDAAAAAATEAAGAAGAAEVEPGVAAAAEGSQQPETVHQQRDSVGGSTAAAPGGDGGSAVVLREELPDVVLIKDEDSDSDDSLEEDNKASSDGGSTAAAAAAREPPVGRRAKRRWRGSEESTPKVSVYALDSPRSEPGRSARLSGADEMEAGESVCSYSSDVQLVHQECSLLPGANRQTYFANGALMESPTNRAELDLSLTWTKPSKHHVAFAPFHHNDHVDGDAFGIKLVSVSGSTSTDCQLSESSNSALEYDDADAMNFALYREPPPPSQAGGGGGGGGARGKRFMCSVCNRTYATSQNLDVHMRIHTGERPFGCNQCGKKFTQSAHLKSHLIVHSGERPYACTLCSRSFIVKYSLKLHMKKCHLEV